MKKGYNMKKLFALALFAVAAVGSTAFADCGFCDRGCNDVTYSYNHGCGCKDACVTCPSC